MTDSDVLHRNHDPLPISALVAGDAVAGRSPAPGDADRLDACAACRVMAGDLQTVVTSLRRLPRVRRTGDFALDPGTAAPLRPPLWRRVARAVAGPPRTLAGPVGGALTALGLAGLLLTTVPTVAPGSTAGAPVAVAPAAGGAATTGATAAEAARGPQAAAGASGGAPAAGRPVDGTPEGAAEGGRTVARRGAGASARAPTPSLAPEVRGVETASRRADATLAVLSGSFLIAGLGLLGIRWTGGRLGD